MGILLLKIKINCHAAMVGLDNVSIFSVWLVCIQVILKVGSLSNPFLDHLELRIFQFEDIVAVLRYDSSLKDINVTIESCLNFLKIWEYYSQKSGNPGTLSEETSKF